MDNTFKKKYRVDPVPLGTFLFRAPKELVDRNDVIVCVEYSIRKRALDNGMCADYRVWCHFTEGKTAELVYRDVAEMGKLCGLTIAFEDTLLNIVLQSPAAVKAIQKFSGVSTSVYTHEGSKNRE
jgi:hypothetical protein